MTSRYGPGGQPAAEHGPRAADPDRLASTGQRVVGFVADVALAGTVLVTPGMLTQGAVTPDDLSPGLLSVLAAVAFVFLAIYEIVPTALWGRTAGKAVVGTRVVRVENGDVPGWKRAILRWSLPALAFRIPVVGWAVSILLKGSLVSDPLRRGVHDRLAGTIVVRS